VRSVSNKEGEITDAESEPAPSSSSKRRSTVAERAGVSSGASLQSMELETGHLVADEIPDEQEDMENEEEEEEEEDEYEYEDDEEAAFSGFLVDNPAFAVAQATVASKEQSQQPPQDEQPATIEEEGAAGEAAAPNNNKKWRQPTKQAVNMSLRAEQEKTGGKRRLAQDLFRIMQQDTVEAGFSLKPSSEDSMDKWTIQLFQFDEDSNLAKDMKVLGLENIELEMSFPDQYPFEPPFVRVTRPRFKRQTGFVMNGALCMELLTTVRWSDSRVCVRLELNCLNVGVELNCCGLFVCLFEARGNSRVRLFNLFCLRLPGDYTAAVAAADPRRWYLLIAWFRVRAFPGRGVLLGGN